MRQISAVPTEVEALTRTYLNIVDTALPGFVENLYLVGSTSLGRVAAYGTAIGGGTGIEPVTHETASGHTRDA